MDWMNAVEGVLGKLGDPHEDFQQVAQAAPPDVEAGGLSQAFRSDQTPPFPDMLANLFSHSNPDQRAGLLNQLLGSLGPGVLAALPAGLSSLVPGSITPQQANQIPPEQVQQMAAHAERQNPTIVDQVSSFYAQHPQVVKAIGGLALSIALQHMLQRR